MYSPEKTRYFPKACCRPTWNSLRQPGLNGVMLDPLQARSGLSTGLPHPSLESTRFSLNGVSMVRAYETRRTVFVRLTLYATPRRGSASRCVVQRCRWTGQIIPTQQRVKSCDIRID